MSQNAKLQIKPILAYSYVNFALLLNSDNPLISYNIVIIIPNVYTYIYKCCSGYIMYIMHMYIKIGRMNYKYINMYSYSIKHF